MEIFTFFSIYVPGSGYARKIQNKKWHVFCQFLHTEKTKFSSSAECEPAGQGGARINKTRTRGAPHTRVIMLFYLMLCPDYPKCHPARAKPNQVINISRQDIFQLAIEFLEARTYFIPVRYLSIYKKHLDIDGLKCTTVLLYT